jgi:hypothetical protein
MKKLMLLFLLFSAGRLSAQQMINDEAVRYQQERMVFKQWDQDKFKPGSGFLGLNPYYWLTWGLFQPNYHKKDLRPLSGKGLQTQRLGLTGTMYTVDNQYKLQADSIRNTGLSEVANNFGLVSPADPLWLLYYSNELKPVLEHTPESILRGLSPTVRETVTGEGLYNWYKHELESLKERIAGARTANMDRGARILAYHRFLKEYRTLAATWATRTAFAQKNIDLTEKNRKVKTNQVPAGAWTPQTDVEIAKKVLADRKY